MRTIPACCSTTTTTTITASRTRTRGTVSISVSILVETLVSHQNSTMECKAQYTVHRDSYSSSPHGDTRVAYFRVPPSMFVDRVSFISCSYFAMVCTLHKYSTLYYLFSPVCSTQEWGGVVCLFYGLWIVDCMKMCEDV
jgi:hypothetical protein